MSFLAIVDGNSCVVSGKQYAMLPAQHQLIRTEMDIVGFIDLETRQQGTLTYYDLPADARIVPGFDIPCPSDFGGIGSMDKLLGQTTGL